MLPLKKEVLQGKRGMHMKTRGKVHSNKKYKTDST